MILKTVTDFVDLVGLELAFPKEFDVCHQWCQNSAQLVSASLFTRLREYALDLLELL